MIGDIYALCDRALLDRFGLELEDFVAIAKNFHCEIMQYRDKTADLQSKKEYLKRLRKLWDGVLIVNDEIALARLCDGVHIGQEDLAYIKDLFGLVDDNEVILLLKKVAKAKIVGLSTHNLDEVQRANELDVDYIGLGAYRASSTKDVTNILYSKLSEIAKVSKHRVVAIGGIRVFDEIENIWKKAIGTDLIIKALSYA